MIELKLFGKIKLITNGQQIDIENLLGKQLSQLFVFFLFNRNRIITKELLIDKIWPNSENPNAALKYAVHRLRNELNKIDGINDWVWIEAVNGGFQLNPNIEIEIDTLKFESLLSEAKVQGDISKYMEAFEIYKEDFLMDIDADWLSLDRSYFQTLYLQLATYLANYYNLANNHNQAIEICKKALTFDNMNDELIHQYIFALIKSKQYNIALNYYNEISKKYLSELGVELNGKTKVLFDIDSHGTKKEYRDTSELLDGIMSLHQQRFGPMFCDMLTFNEILELMKREVQFTKQDKYLLLFDIETSDVEIFEKALQRLQKIIGISLRINDVYTIYENKVLIILNIYDKDACYKVAAQIVSRTYKLVSKDNARIIYKLIEIT